MSAETKFIEVMRQSDVTGAESINLRKQFAEAGVFRLAAAALASGQPKQFQNAVFKLVQGERFSGSVIAKRILFDFAKSISGVTATSAPTIGKAKTKEKTKSVLDDPDEQEDTISLEDIVQRALSKPKKQKLPRKRSGEESLERVQREIEWIVARLAQNDFGRAEQGLTELITHQLEVSRPEDVVKTLTSVANRAAAYHQMAFADRSLSIAESISMDDPVVLNSRAWLFHLCGQDEKALTQYSALIEQFPTSAYGYTGRAEILRALGRLNEALTQYDAAVERFPTEAVGYSGRAETLRALGRLDEALSQYDAAIERFPTNAVGYNGRAETLRALGRLDEALSQYDAAIERFPTEAVGYNGRAETLRALGQLDEALSQYDAAIELFPTEAVGYNGRAETLRAMGQLDGALEAYDLAVKKFPKNGVSVRGCAFVLILKKDFKAARLTLARTTFPVSEGDWIAENMLAIADLSEGKIDAAIATLTAGIEACPFPEQKKRFFTTLAVARLRKSKQDAREIEKAETDLEKLIVGTTSPTERCVVLLLFAHAAAAKRNRPKAEQYINEARIVVFVEDFARKRLEREIVRRFQLFEPAPQLLAQAEEQSRDNAVFEAEVQLLAS